MEIKELTALQMGRLIAKGDIGCVELAKAVLHRIAETDEKIGAYVELLAEPLLADAQNIQRKIQEGRQTSPLAGVPLAIKDNICTRGVKTRCGSKMLSNFTPQYDAVAIQKIKAADGLLIGKLNMDEFGMGSTTASSHFGKTRNPWNLHHSPGGSSGGAAAAVAIGSAPLAVASDTGGSIRQPCAFCGTSGIKPSYGAVSRFGLVSYASSLEQIGPIGQTVRDCAALLQILSGRTGQDASCTLENPFNFENSFTGELKGRVIGLFESTGEASEELQQAVLTATKVFSNLGAQIVPIALPLAEYILPAYITIACAEATSNLARYDGIQYSAADAASPDPLSLYIDARSEGFGFEVKRRILLGHFLLGDPGAHYSKATAVKQALSKAYGEIFESCDMILSPVGKGAAPRFSEISKNSPALLFEDIPSISVNLAGLPAVSLPCGFSKTGLPLGMQLIGRPFGEKTILHAGDAFQQATDHHKRRCPDVV